MTWKSQLTSAARIEVDHAVLEDIRDAVRHVRALMPDSHLADLAEHKLAAIETGPGGFSVGSSS